LVGKFYGFNNNKAKQPNSFTEYTSFRVKKDIEELLKKLFKEQQKQKENKTLFKADFADCCLLF